MNIFYRISLCTTLLIAMTSTSGCLLAAAGVGAEAGYVATQDDRSTSETLKDQLIVSSIKTKLIADPKVSGFDINVDSFKGSVTLRGALRHSDEIDVALRIARETDGVKEVISKLVIVG